MNVFRSLARSLWKALDLGSTPKDGKARPATAAAPSRLRDGFERAYRSAFRPPSQGDGFDAGVRSAPVDLSGGVKPAYVFVDEPGLPPAIVQSDFVASLDDLALLTGSAAADAEAAAASPAATPDAPQLAQAEDVAHLLAQAAEAAQPADAPPLLAQPTDATPPPAQPADATPPGDVAPPLAPPASPAVAPAATPLPAPSEEGLLKLTDFEPVIDAFEPATLGAEPADAEVAAPLEQGLLTLAAFGPVVDAFEPAAPHARPAKVSAPAPRAEPPAPLTQHTVDLLMPAARPVEAQPQAAAEHFSTLELFDVVDQLTKPEDEQPEAAPAPDPGEPST